jgi:exonuclease SbcD
VARPVSVPTGAAVAIACDFVTDLRGAAPTPAESDLLREAIDACCEDPDADVLVGR